MDELKVYYQFEPTGEDASDLIIRTLYEKYKYHIMWSIRSLEESIVKEGGTICIIKKGGQSLIQITGFSAELADKIQVIITKTKIKL